MAVITGIASGDVRCVLARGGDAIVAGTTGTDDLGVINRVRWNPKRIVVAVLTNIGGLNVGRALASGCRAVVTATAVTRDAGVVESGR